MHSKVTSQVLEDSGEGQRCPKVGACAPESLCSNGCTIDYGTSSCKFKSSQGQWTTAVEQRVNGQLGGIFGLLNDANATAKLCHQTGKQRHIYLSVGSAASVGDIAAQSAVFVH